MRIDSIDHSFVGDLKVELTSPDNSTTVRLIEHVGGPNNGGDDLVDTVFDDEAPDGDRLGRERRSVHRQLPPAGRPAVALRRQAAAGHLEAPRERPLRERHRLAARLEHDDPHRPVRPERERAGDQIQAAPPSLVGSRHASFEFGSPRPNAQFQCRLDGGDFTPVRVAAGVRRTCPEGDHTFEVRAFDQYGNVDGSPAIYTWTVDVTAPGPQIAAAGGATPRGAGHGRHLRRATTRASGWTCTRAARPSGSPSQSDGGRRATAPDPSAPSSTPCRPAPTPVAARQSDAAGQHRARARP